MNAHTARMMHVLAQASSNESVLSKRACMLETQSMHKHKCRQR